MGYLGRVASVIGAVALFAGCGGSTSPIAAPGAMPQSHAIAAQADRGRSWMLPEAKSEDLLYVSTMVGFASGQKVYVYTYPRHRLVGTLTGLIRPAGECVDAAGDIFITAFSNSSYEASTIYEYAHGGTMPIATLDDPGVAYGCAVDRKSGNLAAVNAGDNSNPYGRQYGSVAVYTAAQGNPTMYYSSQFEFPGGCGYDNEANLYLSANTVNGGYHAYLARLASGSGSIKLISLNKDIYSGRDRQGHLFVPSVQWDGKRVTVSSLSKYGSRPVSLYRLSISGSNATVIGTTMLNSAKNRHVGESWIQGKRFLGLYDYLGYAYVASWPYPNGGNPGWTKRVAKNTAALWGVTVSVAPSR